MNEWWEQRAAEALASWRRGQSGGLCWAAVSNVASRLLEAVSALANAKGGLLLLGLSESQRKPASDFDVEAMLALVPQIGEAMTPALNLSAGRVLFEGQKLVAVEVPAVSWLERPCFVTGRGASAGAWVRSADGNQPLSAYAVARWQEMREQPRHDVRPVPEASAADLDATLLAALAERGRRLTPEFRNLPDEAVLCKLGVFVKTNDALCPTVAGLLAASPFPQQFFPRLAVDFRTEGGRQDLIGSVGDMVSEAVRRFEVERSAGRTPEVPTEAFRQALVNALQHRDYSVPGCGSWVRVDMTFDRLQIQNPGGLFGAALDGLPAARNAVLSRLFTLLTDEVENPLAANRGEGRRLVDRLLEEARLPALRVEDSVATYKVTFEARRERPTEAGWRRFDEALRCAGGAGVSAAELVRQSGFSRKTVAARLAKLLSTGVVKALAPAHSPRQRYALASSVF